MRTLTETLKDLHEAGATISLTSGELKVDFGDAAIAESLLNDLRSHADALKSYLPTLDSMPAGWTPKMEITLGSTTVDFEEWTRFDGVMSGSEIAFDTETQYIGDDNDLSIPVMAIAVAYDGNRGYWVRPSNVIDFLAMHTDAKFIFHNCSFDLKVIDQEEGATSQEGLIWKLVDQNRIVDTQEMERLLMLSQLGGTPPPFISLAACAQKHLSIEIDKEAPTIDGTPIRHSFGSYVGKTPTEFPPAFLEYAAGDAIATLQVWQHQRAELYKVQSTIAPLCFGYTSQEDLNQSWEKFGPLSLFVHVKATVVCDLMRRRGVRIDRDRHEKASAACVSIRDAEAEKLRAAGLFVPEKGQRTPKGQKALRTVIKQLVSEREQDLLERGEITEPFERTKTGAISTAQENHKFLAEKCGLDVVTDFAKYERAKKFHNDFLAKLDRDRIHPKFKNLKATGRLSCEGVNIQQIPKCGRSDLKFEPTCRQTMAPEVGHVFAIVDVHQLEGRSLAAFWKYQVKFGDTFAGIIERGDDIHSSLARELHGREPTKEERSRVKPMTFGLPTNMGIPTIQRTAQKQGVALTDEQIQATIDAYHRMAPELEQHLARTRDVGAAAKLVLDVNSRNDVWNTLNLIGGYLDEDLDEETADQLWDLAQRFESILPERTLAEKAIKKSLKIRKPSPALATAVKRYLMEEGVVVQSGEYAITRNSPKVVMEYSRATVPTQ